MKIKIYSTPTCPYCDMAKGFFKERGIEFEDIDVSRNHEAAKEMVEKTGQMSVPVIEIDDKIVIGFNRTEIGKILEEMKSKEKD